MTAEQEFFLQILADHLAGKNTAPRVGVDWRALSQFAHAHQVEGIVYIQCRDFMPAEVCAFCRRFYKVSLFYYANRKTLIQNIREAFSANDIPFFIAKGLEVAKYYPVPSLRTMGDTDLIVHAHDRERAAKTLANLGFAYDYEYTGKEQIFSYNRMEVELHYDLVYEEVVTLAEHQAFFNNCWDYVQDGELDHSFHFLYLITHLRKHLMNQGVGFRQFMDISTVARNDASLNWPWIEEKLDELRLRRFLEVCFALTERWFGIAAPIRTARPEETFIERAAEKIFADGVFGFDNKENDISVVSNEVRNFKGPRWMARLSMIRKHAFPGYRHFQGSERYAFFQGKPWLLPAAWCYRAYLMLRGETETGKAYLNRIMTPGQVLDAREKELQEWGLL